MEKRNPVEHPALEVITQRWSPYGYDTRPVPVSDLRAIFEAARWAASSYNEQPWRFVVGTLDEPEVRDQVLSCLVDANQEWARRVPVLGLGATSLRFQRNDKENRVAEHDLGLAVAHLMLEATARGLALHGMAGIHPDRAREVFRIPEEFRIVLGFAIGYPAEDTSKVPEELRKRDRGDRSRRPLDQTVFTRWDDAVPWL